MAVRKSLKGADTETRARRAEQSRVRLGLRGLVRCGGCGRMVECVCRAK